MSQYAEIQRIFTQDDVNLFGRLSGDMNPVHFPLEDGFLTSSTDADDSDGSSSDSKKAPIVHGILLSSLFSNIFGTLIPGAIYRYQTLKFHHVVHVDELVVGKVVVTKLRQINRRGQKSGSGSGGGGGGVLCTCDTSVIKILPSPSDDVTKKRHDKKSNHEGSNSNSDEEEIITCISGDAQVWLPDLQLVYECREKGG
jgi:acyl dehydratase